ncbi:branched-chain amino acid transaminase [candidate division TA06 bacterium]|nr:branched-chain amino acid transaminase [candidate division TA06 bacterium]
MAIEKEKGEWIWMNEKFIKWREAKIHILSHVIHYGSSVFEGIRVYKTKNGPAVFRLNEHMDRLFNSARIYRMEIPYSKEKIRKVCIQTVKKNNFEECYIRPIVYRGYGEPGVDPRGCPVDVSIVVWNWGKYLGPEALEKGVDVMVSSWRRMAPDTFPAMAKSGGNYLNSQLIKMEALEYGFTEGLALDVYGFVSEGSGENIFLIKNKKLYTPSRGSSILPGVTRDAVITIAREFGYPVREEQIPREFLYIADEIFFTGSAAEITPIRSVDKVIVGEGKKGPITAQLQEQLLGITKGEIEDTHDWLTFACRE